MQHQELRTLTTRLFNALEKLYNRQEGPPLIRYEKEWEQAMQEAESAMAEYNEVIKTVPSSRPIPPSE